MTSAAAAGIFAPAAQMMLYLRNAINVVATPLTTAVSQLEAQGNMEAIRRLYLKGVRYAAYFSFFASVGVMMFGKYFIDLWLVDEFFGAAEVMRILAIGTAFFIPQIIGNAILYGIDKHRYILRVVLIEAAVKLLLSFWLVPRYGMIGMAYASTVPQMLLYVSLYPVLIGRALSVSPVLIVFTLLRSAFLAIFVSFPTTLLLWQVLPPSGGVKFIANVVIIICCWLIGAWFVLAREDRIRLLGRWAG